MVDARSRHVFRILLVLLTPFAFLGCVRHPSAEETGGATSPNAAGQTTQPPRHPADERVRVVTVPNGGLVPDAEVDDQGTIHLVYFSDGNVYYVKSSSDERSLSKPIRVNSEAGFAYGGAFRGPDLAIGQDGRIHVVWYNAAYQQRRPQDEWGVMYSRLNTDGTAFEPARNLNHKPSDNYSLAADKKGKVAVIWMAGGVFASISRDGGTSFSPALDMKTDPCECCGSRAIYKDSTLSVLFRDKADNDRDTYLAVLPSDARQFNHTKISQTAWHIESCPMTGSFLSSTTDGLIAGWETMRRIYFARLDPRGQMTSTGEILVADLGRYPVVATAPDDITVVAWKKDTTLEWQLFDANDQAHGQCGSAVGETADRPAGVVTKDGNFLLFP